MKRLAHILVNFLSNHQHQSMSTITFPFIPVAVIPEHKKRGHPNLSYTHFSLHNDLHAPLFASQTNERSINVVGCALLLLLLAAYRHPIIFYIVHIETTHMKFRKKKKLKKTANPHLSIVLL